MLFCADASSETSLAVLEDHVEAQTGKPVTAMRVRNRLFTVMDAADDLPAGQVIACLRTAIQNVGYDPEAALSHA